MQGLRDPRVGYSGRNVLAQKAEIRTEGTRHGENISHVLLLLLVQKEVLRLIGKPEVTHRGIVRSGKDSLPDVRKDQTLQEQAHPARDRLPGAVDEHDLALVLQAAEIRSGRSRERELHSLGSKQRIHSGAECGNGLLPFLREVTPKVEPHLRIL